MNIMHMLIFCQPDFTNDLSAENITNSNITRYKLGHKGQGHIQIFLTDQLLFNGAILK